MRPSTAGCVGIMVGIVTTMMLTPQPEPETETVTQVVMRPTSVEQPQVETPIADSLIDWEEQDRQNNCLWQFLQEEGTELTLQNVIAAGDWTDANGGACAMIGED